MSADQSYEPRGASTIALRLRFMLLRRSVRKAYDLMRFGTGTTERLCASFIAGSLFFGIFLAGSILGGIAVGNGILLAAIAFAAVIVPSAALILGPPDESLDRAIAFATVDVAEARRAEIARREMEESLRQPAVVRDTQSPPRMQQCPYCKVIVLAEAIKCRHCGEILDEKLRQDRSWNPGVAAVLSLIIPGAGQMYKGQVGNGFAWLFFVALGYFPLVFPGILLHIACVAGAASGKHYRA